MTSTDWPIAVRMVDLDEPLRGLDDVEAYPRVRVFARARGRLLGSVEIWNARRPITAARLSDELVERLGFRLAQLDVAANLTRAMAEAAHERPSLPREVPVSVVVPTCGRADDLRRCLASLLAQRTDRLLDIVVVDNRPGGSTMESVVRDYPGVRLISEPRPGLSYARNAGFAAAASEILVATDDDVVAPPDWIEKLVAPFARPEVAAVTGHVLPLQLETEAQCRFEAYGGLGRGFEPLEADRRWFSGMRGAVPTWKLGATANAAFRATVLSNPHIGLMEPMLGAGMPTGCSEDTYLFYRILRSGWTIVYQPSAYVWHRHRDTHAALKKQIYDYSKGHVAYQLLTLFRERDSRSLVRLGWSLPLTYARRALDRVRGRSEYPLSLLALEIAGNLAGPWALWRSWSRVRRLGRSLSLQEKHAVSLEGPLTEDSAR